MYGPDNYLFETNMALLTTLTDEELSDAELIAQLAPGTTALLELGAWLAGACARAFTAVYTFLTLTPEQSAHYRTYPPLY